MLVLVLVIEKNILDFNLIDISSLINVRVKLKSNPNYFLYQSKSIKFTQDLIN